MAAVVQVILTIQLAPSTNPTFDSTSLALTTTVVQTISIVTACFPYLKPFIESLESGMIRSDDLYRRQGGRQSTYNRSHGRSNPAKQQTSGSSKTNTQRSVSRNVDASLGSHMLGRPDSENQLQNITLVTADKASITEDGESTGSGARMIRQTTTWGVDGG